MTVDIGKCDLCGGRVKQLAHAPGTPRCDWCKSIEPTEIQALPPCSVEDERGYYAAQVW